MLKILNVSEWRSRPTVCYVILKSAQFLFQFEKRLQFAQCHFSCFHFRLVPCFLSAVHHEEFFTFYHLVNRHGTTSPSLLWRLKIRLRIIFKFSLKLSACATPFEWSFHEIGHVWNCLVVWQLYSKLEASLLWQHLKIQIFSKMQIDSLEKLGKSPSTRVEINVVDSHLECKLWSAYFPNQVQLNIKLASLCADEIYGFSDEPLHFLILVSCQHNPSREWIDFHWNFDSSTILKHARLLQSFCSPLLNLLIGCIYACFKHVYVVS